MINIKNLTKFIDENKLGQYIENEDLKKYTSLNIGGVCELMYFPDKVSSLIKVHKYLKNHQIEYQIIGKGTNLLINDRYFNEVFINLKNIQSITKLNNNIFYISAGISSNKVSREVANLGYTGIEFLSIIPGTIGGATYMNAGAYNMEMADIIEYVAYLTSDGYLKLINKEESNFKYRSSIFQQQKGIILGVIIKVSKTNYKMAPKSKILSYIENKKNTQPIGQKNAGSTFKNTEYYSAWQIIDKIGYRGKTLGGAMISKKHANFFINYNHATFSDMINLLEEVKNEAKDKLNIELEIEWKILK